MEEFEPVKKIKLGKAFYLKYVYVIVLGFIVYLGVSYSLTFFKQNYLVAEGSLSLATVNITLDDSESSTSVAVNATGLSKDKPFEFIKNIKVENTSNYDGLIKLSIERTSGIELSNLKYSLSINGVIREINDVPENGLLLTSTIMKGEEDNIEVRLWPKDDYTGSEETFVGNLKLERNILALTGSGYINSQTLTGNNNYVYFNCSGSTCEKWRIASVTDDRLVLTTDTYYGNTFTNSNLFNQTLVLNDYSLVTSMSTDNHAVYLKKTVEIIDGNGTIDKPYKLSNNDYNINDEKIIGYITYNNGEDTLTQPIYKDKDNYISKTLTIDGFQGWSTTNGGTVEYNFGDTVTFTSDTNLYAVVKNYLSSKIKQLCNDSSVTYVKPYTSNLGTTMDTYDGRGTEDVCYYTSDTSDNLAGQNGNVLFGGYCWQIVRTTDTGGIKLIYNGKAENNQCLTTRSADIGVIGSVGTQYTTLSGDKLYGSRFEIFDDSGTNKFRLLDTNTYNWSDSTYQNITGKYTCLNTSDTCTTLYYVGHYQSNTEGSTEKYTIGTQAHYSQIGTSSYNAFYDIPALVGYMYNKTYNQQSKTNWRTASDIITRTSISRTTAYFYGDTATWNPSTNKYDLTIGGATPTASAWSSIYSTATGMYTCRNTTDTSCATVYYIEGATSSYMYNMPLSNNEDINTKTITVGTGYTESSGDYTLTGTSTLYLKDWYANYSKAGYSNFYTCSDFTSSTCSELYHIGETTNYQVSYNKSSNNYYFGNSVTYQNGSYTIDTNTDSTKYQQIWDWYKKYNTINNSHYTCFNTTDNTCGSSVYYVYYTSYIDAYYIELKNEKTVEDALKEMLNYKQNSTELDSNINVYNSSIKGIIDNFYETKLSSTAKTFLDTSAVFCNDRSVRAMNAWNPTGGSTTGDLLFNQYSNNRNLTCANVTDRFSTENTAAELSYPIGILSEPERYLMNSYYAKTGQLYWGLSPYFFYVNYGGAYVRNVGSLGVSNYNLIYESRGARPAVSLRPDVEITGEGTYDNPYVIVGSN